MLLLIEANWLLMHLQIIPNPFKTKDFQLQQKPAGYVMKSQHELRKRGMNSLVWENSQSNDTLYYYDSVLTLSQSSATLFLSEETEVHLSENTLVTIEPQTVAADSQIRLKFTRGDLRARNPYRTAKIETKDWTLDLNQGSEISLKQTGQDDFEIEVIKGNLEFQKGDAKEALGENQVLKIEDNKVAETMKIENDLKFEGPEYQRIYSFQEEAKVPVQWKGEADKIQIAPVGKEKQVRELASAQTSEHLDLRPGKYTLRLMKEGKVSEAKEIEIWQAPSLHLLSPFPRDRVKTHENISFVWSYMDEAKEYKFLITDLKTGKITEKIVKDNSTDFSFLEEADISWKIIGIDHDGYEFPSPYSNEVYPRHEIFAAPKLKNPEIRVPASTKQKPGSSHQPKPKFKGMSFLWNLLVHQAQAKTKEKKSADYEAVFAWEPVTGADLYTIEISDTPDFRTPKISKTIKKTEFIWSKFSLGTYYWRVAAGSSKGRMGLFSEAAKVELDKLPENQADSDGVLIRKKKELVAPRAPVVTKTEEIFKEAPKPQFDESLFEAKTELATKDQRELRDTYLIEATPVVTDWTLNGENELKAKLTGSNNSAFHFQTEQLLADQRSYLVDVFYAQYKWKAPDPIVYPFQNDQNFMDLRAQVLFGDYKSRLLRGAIIQTVPYIERKDFEKIEIKTALAVGPSVYATWIDSERAKSGHTLSLMAGSSAVFAISSQHSMRYLFYKGESSALSIGLRFQGDFIFFKRTFSSGWTGGISLGFEN